MGGARSPWEAPPTGLEGGSRCEGGLSTPFMRPRTIELYETSRQELIFYPLWTWRARSRATDSRRRTSRDFEARSCRSCAKEDEEPGRCGSQPSKDLECMRTTSLSPTKNEVLQKRSDEKERASQYFNSSFFFFSVFGFRVSKNSRQPRHSHAQGLERAPTLKPETSPTQPEKPTPPHP